MHINKNPVTENVDSVAIYYVLHDGLNCVTSQCRIMGSSDWSFVDWPPGGSSMKLKDTMSHNMLV